MTSNKVTGTVVVLDLVGYSTTAREVEENTSVVATKIINDWVQETVDKGLLPTGASRAEAVKRKTGDGAILFFESAVQAHLFA